MSLLGYDSVGSATINGLTEINANNVYSDVLYYDADTVPVNVKTAIGAIDIDVTVLEGQMVTANANIATLQGQMTTANSNIATLQGQMTTANSNIATLQGQYSTLNGEVNTLQSEMNTAQSDINTLQSEMNTAQSDINTLQSEMNTAQSDINDLQTDVGVLYGFSATNTAAIAGLSVSQAAQDVTLAAHTASIGGLNTDVNNLDGRVDNLEVKTDDQSWTTLGGTRFSRQVSIANTGASPGTDAVYLGSSVASTFLYGISATGNIATAGVLTSTSGTSQVSSLLVNNNFEVTNVSYFGDTLFCDRNVLTSSKKVVLYDANTGNDYDYLGFWTDSGSVGKKFLNAEIDGVAGSAFQWYYGNNLGSARTLAKYLSSAEEIGYTALATFLKSTGATQQIQLVRDSANNRVRIDFVGDTAMVGQFDGQIIQLEGNGVDDNRGTMTVQSGNLTLNALTSATTGTLQANAKVVDINASGAITIDGATTTAITSVDDLTIQTTNPFGDILVSSAGASTLTSAGQTQINSGILDINATGAVTLDSTSTIGITGTTNTILGITNINRTGSSATSIGNTGALTLTGSTYGLTTTGNQTITSSAGDVIISGTDVRLNSTGTGTGEFIVRANTNVDIKSTTGNIVSDANTTHDLISGGVMTLTAGAGLTCTTVDVGADMSFIAENSLLFKANVGFWTAQSSSNYYYQAGTDDYIVTYGNQTGSQFLNTEFVSGATPLATIKSTSHKVRIESDVETLVGKDASTTTIDGSTINLSGNTVQDVGFTNNMMPTGTIITSVVSTVPSGFLLCNGQAVSRTVTYSRLFAAIGTTYGVGNGTTTFNVPNFQGCFLRGASNQTIGGVVYTAGAVGTAQQDSVLEAYNEGYWNVDSGGGGTSRSVRSRLQLTGDPEDTGGNSTTKFLRQNATENRPVNHAVYYYIRF